MAEFLLLAMIFSPWETFEVVSVAVFFANIITVCLPNKVENKYLQLVIDFLNSLSMNIFRNANRLDSKRYPLPPPRSDTKKKKRSKPPKVGGRDA